MGKQTQQFPFEHGEGDSPHRLAGIDQDVPAARKVSPIQPEDFAHSPPQAIAPDSIPQTHRRGDPPA